MRELTSSAPISVFSAGTASKISSIERLLKCVFLISNDASHSSKTLVFGSKTVCSNS